VFVGLGFWWGLPVLSGVLLIALLTVSLPLPLRVDRGPAEGGLGASRGIPARFWLFAAFVVLYGICETMNGNWAQLDMTSEVGSSATVASLALAAFWGMVTIGRVLFASLRKRMPPPIVYRILPFLLAAALVWISVLPHDADAAGILAFGLAGLGCSALLPLTISFAQEQLTTMSAAAAGMVIAFYQVGYGIAAFGTGPLRDAGVGFPALFAGTAVVAVLLGIGSFLLTRTGQPRS